MSTKNGFLTRAEESVKGILETVITVFFTVILTLTILLVILRYVFNTSIMGGNELMGFLFIYTTALGAAVSIGNDHHIKITYFVDFLPLGVRKIVDSIGYLLIIIINVVISYLSIFWITKVGSSESPVMRIPMWTVQISVPIGCLFVVLFCLVKIIENVQSLNKEIS